MTRNILLTLAAAAICIGTAGAQVKIAAKVKGIEAQLTKSPDFEVSDTREKRSDSKDWLEVEVGFEVESTGKGDFVSGVQVQFFMFPKSAQEKEMRKVLTASVDHVNLLKGETLYSAVYISPNTLARLFGKGKTVNTRDIAVAIEIHSGGIIGGDATEKKSDRWWQGDKIGKMDGFLRPKHETPFANLWYDRYAEVKR